MKQSSLLLVLLSILLGCEASEVTGPAGPAGSAGAAGTTGTDGQAGQDGQDGQDVPRTAFRGTVTDGTNPVVNAFVRLQLLNFDGALVGTLASTQSSDDGVFTVTLTDIDEGSSFLIYHAETPFGVLSGYLTGTETAISPASTAVATIINQIVSSEGGAFVTDFTSAEITELVTAADSALLAANTDQTDLAAVYQQVLMDVGESVADASQGTTLAAEIPTPTPDAPANVQTDANFDNSTVLELNNGANWDVESDGQIDDGTDDAYDTMFGLKVDNVSIPSSSSAVQGHIEDDRELVLGPYGLIAGTCNDGIDNDEDNVTDSEDPDCESGLYEGNSPSFIAVADNCDDAIDNDGDNLTDADDPDCANGNQETTFALVVTRKVHIGATGGWCRFVDFMTNVSDTDSTHTATISGNLGSDGYEVYGPTSSGDNVVDAFDNWHTSLEVYSSGSDPALGFSYRNAATTAVDDDLEFIYPAMTILPGTTVAIATFGFQDPTWGPMENIADTLNQLQVNAPNEYFVGLTAEEISQLVNVDGFVVSGTAGSVAPGALVTLTNSNTGVSLVTKAKIDGSYAVIYKATSGDTIEVTTNYGRSDSLVVE